MSDKFGDRMKGYEAVWDQRMPSRMPVMLRLDGNSFSKFTKKCNFHKPFDERMFECMWAAATAVLKYCSGAQIAYTQSDEITILLRNDQCTSTEPFLGNRIQKLNSLCSSIASVAFNSKLREFGIEHEAVFDCRAFIVPQNEVCNAFLWRQLDSFKNFVSSYAYHEIGRERGKKTTFRMLHNLNTAQKQELIFRELGVNINDLPTHWRRGACISRIKRELSLVEAMGQDKFDTLVAEKKILDPDKMVIRSSWEVDLEIPRFDHNRDYIEKLLAE